MPDLVPGWMMIGIRLGRAGLDWIGEAWGVEGAEGGVTFIINGGGGLRFHARRNAFLQLKSHMHVS